MKRRDFIRNSALLPLLGSMARAKRTEEVVYVGSAHSIAVFSQEEVQHYPSRRPVALAIHPNRKLLFAANDIADHLGLPTASVESYAIGKTGQLTLVSRQSLSLSAIGPRHLAFTPNGCHLLVAVYGGGAYNVLPVSKNGEIGPVCHIVKEMGCGPNAARQGSAHPHSLACHPSGAFVFATDLGSDQISVFDVKNSKLSVRHRVSAPSGSGPAHLAVHPDGSLLFVLGELNSVLSCYRFHPPTGKLKLLSATALSGNQTLAIHPSGRYLYTQGIRSWKIDQLTGRLSILDELEGGSEVSLAVPPNGESLYAMTESSLSRIPLNPATGRFGRPRPLATLATLAKLDRPKSLALLSL